MAKPRRRSRSAAALAGGVALGVLPVAATAQEPPRPNLNFYGVTGAIDTPTAHSQPDGEFSATSSYFAGINRNTLSFQFAPRIQGSFRYSGYYGLNFAGFEDYYDRSFDLSFQLLRESRYLPALKVGLQDLGGTGILAGEYLVASKTFGDVVVSAGLGWGRLGSENAIGQPFGERPPIQVGEGGQFNTDQWFRGDAAPFASVIWRTTDRLTLMAEYSSDAYEIETGNFSEPSSQLFERKSSFNFGAAYQLTPGTTLGAYYLYGSELGINLNFSINPYRPPIKGSIGPAPGPVAPRPDRASNPELWTEAWTAQPSANDKLLTALHEQLEPQGLIVESLRATGSAVDVRVRNNRYNASAQAVGRVARALSRTMPPSVETFRIVPASDGLPLSAVTLRRSDLEALVNAPGGSSKLLAAAGIGGAGARPAGSVLNDALFPRFDWSVGPYLRRSYFDPASPIRAQAGIRATASFEPHPGLVFSGSISKRLVGNLQDAEGESNSQLPHVRTDADKYNDEGDPALETLTAAYYFRPGEDLYGRVTLGYLERMFGGVSGEVLWKPVNSDLGIGVELNYVKQREFELGFGFQDYDVVTGHVSAYYEFGGGYTAQLDVGRYLAGDVGATLAIDREFRNGWSVGAFATKTDVSAEEFGEGSFDKGIRFSIPLSWFTGEPSKRRFGTTIRPLQRDGGARLNVDGRLYDRVESFDRDGLEDQWGRVFR